MNRRISTLPMAIVALITVSSCTSATAPADEIEVEAINEEPLDPTLVAQGREIFRYDDFGDWRFWTGTLRLNELVQGVSPVDALGLGLKVDVDAIPESVLTAVLADAALLEDPATTVALLELNAVLGLNATVEDGIVTRIGVTCALCHSTVDDSVTAGIGHRLDGWANTDLAVGPIISLTPGLPDTARSTYAGWLPGMFDPRFNIDGIDDPVVISPAYGLRGVPSETYTGDGPVSYWNAYVAVTQMGAHGNFQDERLGINMEVPEGEDELTGKLPALRAYQLSLLAPIPPAGSFDDAAATRGKTVFSEAGCATCHAGTLLTSETLHEPSATGMNPTYAQRSATGKYRATPLRALFQHAPYFHDGSAQTLSDVVEHYDATLGLALSSSDKVELEAYLSSL